MSRPISRRFNSFLGRFESRLEVDCERLKRQLILQVDQQFGFMRGKVTELRSRFGGGGGGGGGGVRNAVGSLHLDDPPVEIVSLNEWILERRAAESRNAPSTSSGHKRKSASRSRSTSKRRKTTIETNKYVCSRCGKEFDRDPYLAEHERIHLGTKPFSCSWANCGFSASVRNIVVTHIRLRHFKLPKTLAEQHRLNIKDNRDVNDYIQVDNDLLERRLN